MCQLKRQDTNIEGESDECFKNGPSVVTQREFGKVVMKKEDMSSITNISILDTILTAIIYRFVDEKKTLENVEKYVDEDKEI